MGVKRERSREVRPAARAENNKHWIKVMDRLQWTLKKRSFKFKNLCLIKRR